MNEQEDKKWDLVPSAYRVKCAYCLDQEEAIFDTPERSIEALKNIGWQLRRVGPICPDCAGGKR